jgi:hypothetical protein
MITGTTVMQHDALHNKANRMPTDSDAPFLLEKLLIGLGNNFDFGGFASAHVDSNTFGSDKGRMRWSKGRSSPDKQCQGQATEEVHHRRPRSLAVFSENLFSFHRSNHSTHA